jgi:hypothetical protein
MEDFRKVEQILADVANQAKAAFNAERDFFAWRADHEGRDFNEFMKRYLQWVAACEPYARSYNRIVTVFPRYLKRLEEIVLPIKHAIFGTE